MIVEFEVEIDSSNQKLVDFFKTKRWSISNVTRKTEMGKICFSRNTFHYDNSHRLLWQAIILPNGDFVFYEENKKEFDFQVKNARKNKIELNGSFVPSIELINVVQESCKLGTVILRTIGDDTRFNNLEKIELPLGKFNKYFFLHKSMELYFKV